VVNKIIAQSNQRCGHYSFKREVPILCYHNIKDFDSSAGPMTKVYTVKPTDFAAQMKALSEAGYHTILPAQLYDYLLHDRFTFNNDYF
jgi:hypothetical protein